MIARKSDLAVRSVRLATRSYSSPSIKRYTPLTSPLSVFWAHGVTSTTKLSLGLISVALSAINFHPDVLVTVVPPAVVAAYFGVRKFQHSQYLAAVELVKTAPKDGNDGDVISVRNYDESDIGNVMKGIENEYDSWKNQVLPLVERKMIDYVTKCDSDSIRSPLAQSLLDTNKQVVVHVEQEPETFVISKAEVSAEDARDEEWFPSFICFSVPYFDSRNVRNRNRLGTIQVALLEQPGSEELVTTYRMGMQAWPYRMFSKPERLS